VWGRKIVRCSSCCKWVSYSWIILRLSHTGSTFRWFGGDEFEGGVVQEACRCTIYLTYRINLGVCVFFHIGCCRSISYYSRYHTCNITGVEWQYASENLTSILTISAFCCWYSFLNLYFTTFLLTYLLTYLLNHFNLTRPSIWSMAWFPRFWQPSSKPSSCSTWYTGNGTVSISVLMPLWSTFHQALLYAPFWPSPTKCLCRSSSVVPSMTSIWAPSCYLTWVVAILHWWWD